MEVHAICLLASIAVFAPNSLAESVTLLPTDDATIHSASNGIDQAANGAGAHLFAGWTTRFGERRALVRFDVASALPTHARVVAASLHITVDRANGENHLFRIHRVLESWNEGPSLALEPGGNGAEPQTGDVTWNFRRYAQPPTPGQAWTTPGAYFAAVPSGAAILSFDGTYTFASTDQSVADVQLWLDAPSDNHGWVILADDPFTSGSAKRIVSREHPVIEAGPTLTITYTTCGDVDFNNDSIFPDDRDVVDFFEVLAGAECAACDSVDFNGDGVFPDDRDITAFFSVLAGGSCD